MAVRTEFTGDAASLLREQQKINREAQRTEASFSKVAEEANELSNRGQRAFSRIEKSVKDYNQRLGELKQQLKDGVITQDQFAASVEEANRKAESSTREAQESLRDQVDLIRQASAEERRRGREAAKVYEQTRTPLERLNQRTKELRDLWRNNAISLDTFKRSARQALQDYRDEVEETVEVSNGLFDASKLSGYVAGFASLATAANAIRAIYQDIRQLQEEAAARGRTLGQERGTLAQVATSREDFVGLVETARQLRASGVTDDTGIAEQIVFALRSTGQETDTDTFATAGRSGLVTDVTALVNSVDTLVQAFGRDDAGTADTILSQGLATSGFTQRTLEEVLQATATVGASARAAGLDNEQAQAAIATIAGPRGSVTEAASRVNALLAAFDKAGIEVTSIADGIAQVNQRVATAGEDGSVRGVLGDRQETLEAFRTLSNSAERFAEIEAAIREQSDAMTSLFQERAGFTTADQTTALEIQRRQLQGRSDVGEEVDGQLFQARENLRTQFREVQRLAGVSSARQSITGFVQRASQAVDRDDLITFTQLRNLERRAIERGVPADEVAEDIKRLVEIQQKVFELDRRASNPRPRVQTTKPEGVN